MYFVFSWNNKVESDFDISSAQTQSIGVEGVFADHRGPVNKNHNLILYMQSSTN